MLRHPSMLNRHSHRRTDKPWVETHQNGGIADGLERAKSSRKIRAQAVSSTQ
jgi:hypothetical protein